VTAITIVPVPVRRGPRRAPVAQLAEATDSKPVQCQFESDRGHTDRRAGEDPLQSSPPALRTVDILRRASGALAVVAALHVIGFGLLFALVIPRHLSVGGQVFGIGLAMTAYVLGVRHAFDADHIAAIDNTTRKLVGDGRSATSAGLFFSLGHSTVVFGMAVLIAVGASFVGTLVSDGSGAHQTLGIIGTTVSGVFLLIIGVINLMAMRDLGRVWTEARRTGIDERALDEALNSRGFLNRLLRPVMSRITRPGQLYPVGLLFGLGFDTATEISLLVLAGAGASTGLPWYAVLVLPILFAAGMSLFDTLDGAFMQAAYQWAFVRPVRKIFYNLVTTGLSVVVALIIGGIQLVALLHDELTWTDPVTTWVAGLGLDQVGFIVVGLFVLVFAGATMWWRLARVEDRRPGADGPG
jgi:nickel/cobalt transporter (NiCoT) family protein